ncbi:MAG: Ppx/GppA family phosphatase [Balneolaceae bacterium]
MIRAAIDIGTNSVLLLVADVANGRVEVLDEQFAVPRLGEGVDREGKLSEASMERVVQVVERYSAHLKKKWPGLSLPPIVTATSAVRDAGNRDTFMEMVRQRTGLEITLLSGEEEAQATFIGALSVIDSSHDTVQTIIDIGGGSTEYATGTSERLGHAFSVDMGSVRFSERYLSVLPPDEKTLNTARLAIRNELKAQSWPRFTADRLVGVAGTVTSLAAIALGLTRYEPEALNGYRLSLEAIQAFIGKCASMSSAEIEETWPLWMENRGDVILGGLLILDESIQMLGHDAITVSTGGIRHGILLMA